jgi:branched-chain amino acid transport system permease protein
MLFDRALREQIARLLTPKLIEEHERTPIGPQSDQLARVLNYFRRAPIVGKYAVWAKGSFGPYRVIALSGARGQRPRVVDEQEYQRLEQAYHAIFLRRVADFRRHRSEDR